MGMLIVGENDLGTWSRSQGEYGQKLLKEFDIDYNYSVGNNVEPECLAKTSSTKVWWKCSKCGHRWKSTVYSRTKGKTGCPACTSQVAKEGMNDLLTWCNKNGSIGEKLIKEWDAEGNMEEFGFTMKNITSGSSKKVHWKCMRCGRRYDASISHRTSAGSDCPYCCGKGTSYPELFIYYSLKMVFPNAIHRGKAFNKIEYDICIPEMKMCIEYGATYWHQNREEKDKYKKDVCDTYGVKLIVVEEDAACKESEFSPDYIRIPAKVNKDDILKKVVEYILKLYGRSIDEVDIDEVRNKVNNFLCRPVEEGKSVAELYKSLAEEWDVNLNNGARPECFTKGSRKRIKWKCKRCGNIWGNTIKNRTRFKSGCPRCGYNIFDGKVHENSIIRNGCYYKGMEFI